MSYLEQAEHLVRNHPANKELMRLENGCEIKLDTTGKITTFVCSQDTEQSSRFWIKSKEYDSPTELSRWGTGFHILGKPAHLEHYLRVLEGLTVKLTLTDTSLWLDRTTLEHGEEVKIKFNLTTGKPATEKDAEEFIKLIENK